MTHIGRLLSLVHEYLLYVIQKEINEREDELLDPKLDPEIEANVRESIRRLKRERTDVTNHCFELRKHIERREK